MSSFDQEFQDISKLLNEKTRILLATDQRPDGDAIGSMIGMFSAILSAGGKEVVMFSKDPVPENLRFLPGCQNIVHEIPKDFSPEVLIGLDYGDFDRLGIDEDVIKDAVVVTFDHHPRGRQKGDIFVIAPYLSSTCELVYSFLVHEGFPISSHTAEALLMGIFTDTGGFAHINTSTATLEVSANLLGRGIYTRNLHKHTFSGKPLSSLRAWGWVLQNLLCDYEIGMCYAGMPLDNFINLGSSLDDFEGIVNMMNMPPDTSFSLLLIEYKPR